MSITVRARQGSPYYNYRFTLRDPRSGASTAPFRGSTGIEVGSAAARVQAERWAQLKHDHEYAQLMARAPGAAVQRDWTVAEVIEIRRREHWAIKTKCCDGILHTLHAVLAKLGPLLTRDLDDRALAAYVAWRRGTSTDRVVGYEPHGNQAPIYAMISGATVNRELSYLRAALNHVRKYVTVGDITWSEHRLSEQPRSRWASIEELRTLLRAAAAHLVPIIVLAVLSGLRKTNVATLDWAQVDLTGRQITVLSKSKKFPQGKVHAVHIDDDMLALLRRLGPKAAGPVFWWTPEHGRTAGVAQPVHNFRSAWRGAVKRAGLGNFRFHDIRRTFAMELLRETGDIKLVSESLGHADIKVTMTHYAHHVAPTRAAATARVSATFAALDPSRPAPLPPPRLVEVA